MRLRGDRVRSLMLRPLSVIVRFKAVGNAPIMKQNFYKITASNRFQAVIQFLRKELGWKQGDPLVSLAAFARVSAHQRCLSTRLWKTVHVHKPSILACTRRHRREFVQGSHRRAFVHISSNGLLPLDSFFKRKGIS